MNPPSAEAGRFRCDPHPALRPFVIEYWGLARDLAVMGGFTITPDCFGELICCVGDLYAVDGGRREKLPTCFFVGLLAEPLRVESAGVVRGMAARFPAWSVGRFLANGPGLRARPWSDAGRVFGPHLPLVAGMVERCEWVALSVAFDQLLMGEVGRWQAGGTGRDVVGPFLGDERLPTAAVARLQQTSGRQVERRVRSLSGTSPKQLASLSRFHKVRDAIWADPSVDLARLALDAGYADQPHLTREFRRYAGQTPARFAREARARKLWLATRDVAFVQDPPGTRG